MVPICSPSIDIFPECNICSFFFKILFTSNFWKCSCTQSQILWPFLPMWFCHYAILLYVLKLHCGYFAFMHRNVLVYFRYTHRNLFEILLNQPQIRLYLPFSDWYGSKRMSVWIHINREMVNKIWFQFDSKRFRKYLSV